MKCNMVSTILTLSVGAIEVRAVDVGLSFVKRAGEVLKRTRPEHGKFMLVAGIARNLRDTGSC